MLFICSLLTCHGEGQADGTEVASLDGAFHADVVHALSAIGNAHVLVEQHTRIGDGDGERQVIANPCQENEERTTVGLADGNEQGSESKKSNWQNCSCS